MKKRKQFSGTVRFTLSVLFAILMVSCNKNADKGGGGSPGPAKISVKVGATVFEDGGDVGKRAVGAENTAEMAGGVQTATMELKEGFMLVAELRPVSSADQKQAVNRAAADDVGTAAESDDLKALTRYGVAVFDAGGDYVTQREYVHTEESSTDPLVLNGGSSYTFIAYSVNSTDSLPAITFADPADSTLATASIRTAGTSDMMYQQKDMVVGRGENLLNITFKHLFSQITTTIDASALNQNVEAVTSSFTGHMPDAVIALDDAGITRSGTETTSPVTFDNLGTQGVTSVPTIINGATNAAAYRLASITIGSETKRDLVPFTDLEIIPGVKYNLTLTVSSSVPDEYLTHAGRLAARINGVIWARHNLGANYNVNPDTLYHSLDTSRIGHFFQWGRREVVGYGSSAETFNESEGYDMPSNSWNAGTEEAPVKTASDPCPTGYRVPTMTEITKLRDGTTGSKVGWWGESISNFEAAAVLTSKRNADVRLTIPAQGSFYVFGFNPPYSLGRHDGRGIRGHILTSFVETFFKEAYWGNIYENTNDFVVDNNSKGFAEPGNIRCVAE